MPERRVSESLIVGTPPRKANVRTCEPVQSGSVWIEVASAKV